MKKIKLGIVGVTGLVGQTIVEVLKEEQLIDKVELVLFASKNSVGKRMLICGEEYKIFELTDGFEKMNLDYAIFSAGAGVSRVWVEKFARAGVVVIDNTSAFRMNKKVPLVVPEINSVLLDGGHKIISNPNCSTIQLVVVLDRLQKLANIEKVFVSTYQSVSGAGRKALFDLINHTNYVFDEGIVNNVIPQIGELNKNGHSEEEQKIMNETKKILDNYKIMVSATAVRVPISNCHSECVIVQFDSDVCVKDVSNALKCEYIEVLKNGVFYSTDVKGSNKTYVCRVRQISKNEIAFVVVADNLRRGAAYNAVKILKHLLRV